MSRCKECNRAIAYIRTSKGLMMPCEPIPRWYKKDPSGKDRILTPDGELVRVRVVSSTIGADGYGYLPHFANCTHEKKKKESHPKKSDQVFGQLEF